MNKPLLLSLAAATILTSSLSAESMYERIQSMELKMMQMQEELVTLKAQDTQDDEDEEETSHEDSEDDEDSDSDEEGDEDSEDEDDDEEETVEDRLADLEESVTDLNKATNGSHLKFGVDYRFAIDNMQYKMADGSEQGNDAFMTNRLWINMNWKATDNLSFSGQLAYNKAFGARSGSGSHRSPFETFDWITNENAYDDVIRVRSAYFLYKNDTFLGTEIPWTFSIGRRPSTNGHLINLREDDGAASPMGHTINVEFDGLSSKFALEDLIGVEGMYVKFCAGRGGTNANPKFFDVRRTGEPVVSAPYTQKNSDIADIDLGGLIFVPYDDGQYGFATQYYYANNLIDAGFNNLGQFQGMMTVGGMHSITANFTMNGLGDEWSDYLDDTFIFVSGAMSITDPLDNGNGGMLGSTDSQTGTSIWAGLQMPSLFTEDGRWGVEYNQGSKYWRSITYAEDTNIGSKMAVRGEAYELYFTEPLIEDILTFQVRATYIDYKYTGSNGFFGSTTGTPVEITNSMLNRGGQDYAGSVVDTAQDIRFYLRYRY
ncbi:DUF3373 domain-containing protein [Sulfurimonas sp. SAG-AH-194-C21]|nr:DUF3373 family protein [Sulfurimonas sp. SAG-AH-194-C21]MDF1882328.1 DUF3373 domain-containing protein [Sulfurimonas sp. SAG-AH-194-C21]